MCLVGRLNPTQSISQSTQWEHLQIFGERRGGVVQKWYSRYKTSDICETKKTLVLQPIDWVTNLVT